MRQSSDQVDLENEAFLHFVAGYRRVRSIDEAELELIPLFVRLGNLIGLARLVHAMTPVNPAGELPWMAELRDKLAAKMQFYRDELSS